MIKCWDYPKEMAIVKQFLMPIKSRMKVLMNDSQWKIEDTSKYANFYLSHSAKFAKLHSAIFSYRALNFFKGPFKCIYLGKQLECTLLDSSFATCNKAQKMTIKRQLLPNNNRNENNNWMIVPSFLLQRKDEENYGNLIATMYTTGNC